MQYKFYITFASTTSIMGLILLIEVYFPIGLFEELFGSTAKEIFGKNTWAMGLIGGSILLINLLFIFDSLPRAKSGKRKNRRNSNKVL